jgi:hypothetical protein
MANRYYFYKENKQSDSGTFEKKMESDDGQNWYGKGTFIEFKVKLMLKSFELIRTMNYNNIDNGQNKKLVTDTTVIPTLIFLKSGADLIEEEKGKHSKKIFTRQNK